MEKRKERDTKSGAFGNTKLYGSNRLIAPCSQEKGPIPRGKARWFEMIKSNPLRNERRLYTTNSLLECPLRSLRQSSSFHRSRVSRSIGFGVTEEHGYGVLDFRRLSKMNRSEAYIKCIISLYNFRKEATIIRAIASWELLSSPSGHCFANEVESQIKCCIKHILYQSRSNLVSSAATHQSRRTLGLLISSVKRSIMFASRSVQPSDFGAEDRWFPSLTGSG